MPTGVADRIGEAVRVSHTWGQEPPGALWTSWSSLTGLVAQLNPSGLDLMISIFSKNTNLREIGVITPFSPRKKSKLNLGENNHMHNIRTQA